MDSICHADREALRGAVMAVTALAVALMGEMMACALGTASAVKATKNKDAHLRNFMSKKLPETGTA